jgi:hypothetical protein
VNDGRVEIDNLRTTVDSSDTDASGSSSSPPHDEAKGPSWDELHRARALSRCVRRDRERLAARGFDD